MNGKSLVGRWTGVGVAKSAIATACLAALAIAGSAAQSPARAEGITHRVAVHVDQNDPRVMNLALNNVRALENYYASVGDDVEVEIVAYGPGLEMFVPGSPVESRLGDMSLKMDNLTLSACGNTLRGMSARAGHEIELLDEVGVVPSGAVRLVELQEQGFAYIRP